MNVSFAIRHLSDPLLRPALEERLINLSDSLSRYFVNPLTVHWTITEEAGSLSVACHLAARNGSYRGHSTHADAYAAANETYEKLVRQRRRLKKKRIGGRRGSLARNPVTIADSGAPSTPEPT